MEGILGNLSMAGDLPIAMQLIFNVFRNVEYPFDKTGLDEWAMNFLPHLFDLRKLKGNFEADNVASNLKRVYKNQCSDDMRSIYEMFG